MNTSLMIMQANTSDFAVYKTQEDLLSCNFLLSDQLLILPVTAHILLNYFDLYKMNKGGCSTSFCRIELFSSTEN